MGKGKEKRRREKRKGEKGKEKVDRKGDSMRVWVGK